MKWLFSIVVAMVLSAVVHAAPPPLPDCLVGLPNPTVAAGKLGDRVWVQQLDNGHAPINPSGSLNRAMIRWGGLVPYVPSYAKGANGLAQIPPTPAYSNANCPPAATGKLVLSKCSEIAYRGGPALSVLPDASLWQASKDRTTPIWNFCPSSKTDVDSRSLPTPTPGIGCTTIHGASGTPAAYVGVWLSACAAMPDDGWNSLKAKGKLATTIDVIVTKAIGEETGRPVVNGYATPISGAEAFGAGKRAAVAANAITAK